MYKGDSADRGTLMILAVERAIQRGKTIQMANIQSKESFFFYGWNFFPFFIIFNWSLRRFFCVRKILTNFEQKPQLIHDFPGRIHDFPGKYSKILFFFIFSTIRKFSSSLCSRSFQTAMLVLITTTVFALKKKSCSSVQYVSLLHRNRIINTIRAKKYAAGTFITNFLPTFDAICHG